MQDDEVAEAYFEIAFDMAGGVPAAMRAAVGVAAEYEIDSPAGARFTRDVRGFRARLAAEMPRCFEPAFFAPEEPDADVAAHIERVDPRAGQHDEAIAFLRDHPWGSLLLNDERNSLRCEAIGTAARAALRRFGRNSQRSPRELYECGEYQRSLRDTPADDVILRRAAEMMGYVFPDGVRDLYFPATTHWRRVRSLAREAAGKASGNAADEFENWARIAEAHEAVPEACSAAQALITLGARALAVVNDSSHVTAAHVAIPLVEDILRTYLHVVLRTAAAGRAFDGVLDEDLRRWWPLETAFRRPPAQQPLCGAELAVAAAVLSAHAGACLMESKDELARVLATLGGTRNRLGHRVTTPGARDVRALSQPAVILLEKLAAHTSTGPDPRELSTWLMPPRAFLANR